MNEVTTPAEAIEVMGGDHAVAKRTKRTLQAVRNWRYGRGIPPALRPFVDAELRKHGKRSASSVYSERKCYSLKLPRGGPQRRET